MICLGTLLANLLFCLPSLSSPIEENVYYKVRPTASTVTATPDEAKKSFAKPAGIEIIAAVMYSRRDRTTILDCYLQRNLVANGGFFDKVIFVPETGAEEQLDWLSALICLRGRFAKR